MTDISMSDERDELTQEESDRLTREAAEDAMFGPHELAEAEIYAALDGQDTDDEPVVTLASLAEDRLWVAWQLQLDKNGRPTKVPYNPRPNMKGTARSNDPSTWATRAEAEKRLATLDKPLEQGGLGIEFCGSDEGWSIGGIDLDTCRCPETGEFASWAIDIIQRFKSYREISPSGTGVKIFFLYKTEDIEELRAHMGTSKYGVSFKWPGKDHPPAIEVHLGNRYFCVTENKLPESGDEFRRVPTDLLVTLLALIGPQFVNDGKAKQAQDREAEAEVKAGAKAEERAQKEAYRERRRTERKEKKAADRSRSAIAFSKGKALHRAGKSYEEMVQALREDPDTAEWTKEKGEAADQRELRRIWAKVTANGPSIKVEPGEVDKAATEAEAALVAAKLPIYQRGMNLVRPISLVVPASKGRVVNVACLGEMDVDALIDRMCPSAEFLQYDARSEDYLRINPPSLVARLILSRAGHWRFPVIAGVITTPTLRPDGSILSEPGYDPVTRLYHAVDPALKLPPIPCKPTKDDALWCLNLLAELLIEFPFVNRVSQSVSLSAMLTAVNRAAMSVAPLHLFRAHTPGTGKSFLVDVVSTIATGRECPVVAATDNREEAEKRLGSLMMTGVPLISLDNVNGEIGSNLLAQAVERPIVQIRQFGTLDTVEIANTATFLSTGNNAFLRGDVVRRGLVGELDAGMERPELREFKGNPVKIIQASRGEYVAACLTIVRAYLEAGMPDMPKPLASFEDWSGLVRGALLWLGYEDPCISQEGAREEDPGLVDLQEMMAALHERFSDNPFTSVDIKARADLRAVSDTGFPGKFAYPEFRELVLRLFGVRGEVNTQMVGDWLKAKTGRIVGGRRLKKSDSKTHGGKKRWLIEKV
jgi:hypothetical protein